jgi:hypothetical protein
MQRTIFFFFLSGNILSIFIRFNVIFYRSWLFINGQKSRQFQFKFRGDHIERRTKKFSSNNFNNKKSYLSGKYTKTPRIRISNTLRFEIENIYLGHKYLIF